ncbi:MAG: 2-hydroxychromene-2-carboxylate isomerase [Paracoccaceae bacterium]
MRIDCYFSVISPFAYLAGPRFRDIAERHMVQVVWRPLDILALFERTGGQPPAQRHPNRQSYRAQDLPRQAKKAGLALNLKPAHFPTNQAPASYAVIAAQSAGGGDLHALTHALGRAVWAEERDIAQSDVIADCITGAGYDAGLADSGMLAGADAYARNLEHAVAAGAFGAPFYVTQDDQRFWGQDRLEDLDLVLGGRL